jgi:isoamylase
MGQAIRDIRWLNIDGDDMTEEELNTSFIRCMGMLLNGKLVTEVNEFGEPIKDDILLLIVNSFWEPISFTLPYEDVSDEWEVLIDTETNEVNGGQRRASLVYEMPARSLVLLRNLKREE